MESSLPIILSSNTTIRNTSILGSFIPLVQLMEEIKKVVEEHLVFNISDSHFTTRPRKLLQAYHCNIQCWYLNTSVFKENFRMLPSTVEELCSILGVYLNKSFQGRPAIDVKRQVLSSIGVLSNQESFRRVSQRFGLDRGHTHVIFKRFVNAIFHLKHQFIRRSDGINRGRIGFETLRSKCITGTVGAIDGCQISIKAPKRDKSSYFNRKQSYSVNLQAVCDHKKSFIDVFVGSPGSSHDSAVFRKSPLFQFLESGSLDPHFHLLGDSGYPLRSYLLVSYKDNGRLSAEEKNFNKIQSSNRCIFEQTFGLLLVRFRRLKYLEMSKMTLLPKVIVTACILHNICLSYNDLLDETQDFPLSFDNHTCREESSIEALGKRNEIAGQLYSNII